jgi:NhaA family Na+:H+ antiporter
VLLAFAVIAMFWANSPWAESYVRLWQTSLRVEFGSYGLDKALLLWINDGLMAIFFFVVGLEIKREVLTGELASLRRATLPIAAALGGMLVPALFYLAMTFGTPAAAGWGIPMATDIAFALGVLALLGDRIPLSLKVFLTALAIVDDLGAVLVIAFFYTSQLSLGSLALGLACLALLALANKAGLRRPLPYALVGIVVWVAFLKSGVHATIAGVLLAMTIPSWARIDSAQFLKRGRERLDEYEHAHSAEAGEDSPQAAIHALEIDCEQVQSPLHRLEHGLHPWVAFVIMPVFALANAGVAVEGNVFATLASPVGLGIALGLILGKQIGVTLFSWAIVKLGLAELPPELTWKHIYGVSWLAGIGFTMSLFVTGLAFGEQGYAPAAKIAILAASLLAGIVGLVYLRSVVRVPPTPRDV